MLPPRETAVLPETDVLGEDWFADGTAFESGEALASALLALAGAAVPAAPAGAPASPPPGRVPAFPPAPPAHREQPAIAEFQVAAMPSSQHRREPAAAGGEGEDPSGWARVAAPPPRREGARRSGWSIRQSVQVLRVTEEILLRLREEAAELAWHLASAALRETDG